MKADVKWVGEAMFLGESGSGHCIVMDGPPDHGGRNMGVRPMEMLLIGMGGCASFDVVSILKKSRQAVTGCGAAFRLARPGVALPRKPPSTGRAGASLKLMLVGLLPP